MRTCGVCGRLYTGYRCPCRKTQHSRARRSTGGGGGRKWRLATRTARILGGWPVDDVDHSNDGEGTPALCERCGTELQEGRCPVCFERLAAEEAGFAADGGGPEGRPDDDFCPEGD